ncbi:unnamed protein product [Rotaria sp. Silwood1]|nr:unnamed protein product [Rotaria sp. Silwood1]CAF3643069.1 unnamed protein product [Rotaria sp. Silwood1]CAF3738173.1 unnamed protein product [Rotaria sp. Silwood1]CAF4688968.1 unnamed protein product [Rotaria sp. Silwood1]CAF4872859.1 unnamed protein product [Rotaria sp. Silwood1]
MTTADALFNEADINRDGVLSQSEFRDFVVRHSTAGLDTSNYSTNNAFNNLATGSGYGSSSTYETSTIGDVAYTGGGFAGTNYDASSYRSSVGNIVGDATSLNVTDASLLGSSSAYQSSNFQQYETDAQGNFKDSNPQIVRRPAPDGQLTYTQNVQVRFLKPPPVPPPGPLYIKEVRPPQPPPPAPLRVRQQAPPLPTPPPLVLREQPPPKPPIVASQTVVRNLPAIPVPPRSVVIDRMPPAPAKPRDIIIERWIPYGPQPPRKTIVQRAPPPKPYPPPRNIIIEYEPSKVRVVRQFQRLGITPENPQEYMQRYGISLIDSQTLLQQARAAGVVEDISAPNISSSFAVSSASSNNGLGFEVNNIGGINAETMANGGSRASFYASSSNVDASSLGGFRSTLSNITPSYNLATGGLNNGINAVFAAADTNNDGVLSQTEFHNAGF